MTQNKLFGLFLCAHILISSPRTVYLVAVEDPVAAIPPGVGPHTLKITGNTGDSSSQRPFFKTKRAWVLNVYLVQGPTCPLRALSWRWHWCTSQPSSLGWSARSATCFRICWCRAWPPQSAGQNRGQCSWCTFCKKNTNIDIKKRISSQVTVFKF